MKWFLKVLKQYVDFRGRARRMEYWMFILFNMIFATIAMTLDSVLGLSFSFYGESMGYGWGWISIIYYLAILLPFFAVFVRRLHDIGKSGWSVLIALIPFVGGIILLVWMFRDSQAGENKWGANPKQ